MHARLDAGRVQILTRRGNDWTDKYPSIAGAIASLPAQNAYLDGELCGVMPDGRTAFNLIQNTAEISDLLPIRSAVTERGKPDGLDPGGSEDAARKVAYECTRIIAL